MDNLSKIKIHDKVYECFTCTYYESDFEAVLKTDDLEIVKSDFSVVDKIIIMSSQNLILDTLTDYSELKGIEELINYYVDDNGQSKNAVHITIKRLDLLSKIEKLESEINPTINEGILTLDEYRTLCKEKLGKQCSSIIYSGEDVETEYGVEHFTFDSNDQTNIDSLFMASLATKLPQFYHPSTSPTTPCRIYSAEDIIKIYVTMKKTVLYHTTYTNQLYILLDKCEDKESMQSVQYGMELPDNNKSILNNAMSNMDAIVKTMVGG